MDDLLRDFLTESNENLNRLDREIVALEQSPNDAELLKSIFRTIHTIKGTCGFLDLGRLERVAHAAENVLGLLRDGKLDVKAEIVSDVLAAVDVIRSILDGLELSGFEPEGDDGGLIRQLDRWVAGHEQDEVDPEAFPLRLPVVGAGPGVRAERAERDERAGRLRVSESSLRVDVRILDRLMNLAGELVLTRNQLLPLAQEDEGSPYQVPLQHLNRVTSDLQEVVMQTRMQPIGNAWGKLPRLVRDLAQESGKRINLEMHGADTELDRQILQAIQDPLTHMIRNSADHGIEPPAARAAAGKPEQGTIRLDAFHEGGQIILEITDDGGGLDPLAIGAKAVERGLATPEQVAGMSDAQIHRFVFEPGFSTAPAITSISGRGVGMDVVRSNLEAIGGGVELSSRPGQGTTVRIKIPLTLAILHALIVRAGGQSFALPQVGVVELVRINGENRSLLQQIHGAEFFRLRDALLPLVRLGELLGMPAGEHEDLSLAVCQVGAQRFGLVVDEVFDTEEIVVKPIGRMVKRIPFYSGTTILGDGRVIMILDVPSIATASRIAEQAEHADAALAGPVREEARDEPSVPLVVFRAGDTTHQAVPLALVARLEKVPGEQIERADGRWLVQYRGSLLPLVPATPEVDLGRPGERPVIVFGDGGRQIGLGVDEVYDIVDEPLRIQMASERPGLIGTAVVQGRSTEILDVNAFLQHADPAWFRTRPRTRDRRRVLLVDDSPFFLNLIAPALQAARFDVSTASDGSEALERLEQGEHFDVIVSDIDMPEVDGFELARRIAASDRFAHVPMLALTGRAGEAADREHGLEAGFREFLPKLDRAAVLRAIESVLADQGPDEPGGRHAASASTPELSETGA